MKKNSRKKIVISVTAVVLVIALGVGIWFGVKNRKTDPVYVFEFFNIGMTEYWGDTQESYGPVSSDNIQTVFLSDTQEVTEVLVKEGDTVKKGDLLMRFDTTLSDIELERKRLEVEKLKLQLEDEKRELQRINSLKPMQTPPPMDPGEPDENLGVSLSSPYKLSSNPEYDGSSPEKALICWVRSDTTIDDNLLENIRLQAEKLQNLSLQRTFSRPSAPSDDTGDIFDGVDQTDPVDPEPTTEPPTDPPTDPSTDPSTDPTVEPGTDPDPSDPTVPSEPVTVDSCYVVFKVTEGNMSLGGRRVWQGMLVKRTGSGFGFRFFDAGSLPDYTMVEEENDDSDGPEFDFGSGMTAGQIAEMRVAQQKKIKEAEFNVKMAEANYKIMLTEVNDGNIHAEFDGVVVSLMDAEEAKRNRQPMMKVSAGGGYYIEGTISELAKETVQLGQEVTVNDWNTGMVYTGVLESIGDFPVGSDGYNGRGNPNVSYYPLRVFVDESADLQTGSYVSVMYEAGGAESGIYLEKPFLRTEGGKTYVYVMGENDRLEKREVTTGKSLWGSYTEVTGGLTEEDLIAFPYGKNVKPGARAELGEMSDLYGN